MVLTGTLLHGRAWKQSLQEVQPLIQRVAAGGAACVIAHGQANATEALLTSGSAQSPSLGMRAITALLKCVNPMRSSFASHA